MEQPTRRVNVRAIIFKNGKLFAQQLKVNGGSNAFWSTPGGGLDPNESLIDGLHREMIEETGVAPKIGKLLFMQQFHDGKKEQLEFFFHVENGDDYETIDLAATSHGEIEVSNYGFIDPKTEVVLPEFLTTINVASYINSDLPVFIKSEL